MLSLVKKRKEMKMLIVAEVAQQTGKNPPRIRQLARELSKKKLAVKKSHVWLFEPAAVEYIRNMPDMRGKWRVKK